jgi:predicted MFS family arabinose efflux permease
VVVAYGLVAACTQMLWLTYAPITTGAARHYGVSEAAIGWLANMFPLLYVLLALPAGIVLDRWFRGTLAVGAILTALGAVLRLFGGYEFALAGQIVVAVAQPLVLNAISKLAEGYLSVRQRPLGIAVASAGNLAGMLIALVLGAAFGVARLTALLQLEAVVAAVAAVLLCLGLRTQGSASIETPARVSPRSLAGLFLARETRALGGVVFLGFGVFIALTTWLEPLLKPAGVSTPMAGTLLAAMVLSGIVGSVLLPAPTVHRRLERLMLAATVGVTVAGCLVLAVAPSVVSAAVVVVVVGFPLLAALPVVLDLTERVVGPAGGSTGAAYIYLAGNAGGLVVALAVQQLLARPAAAFVLLAAVTALAASFLRDVPTHTPEPHPHDTLT